MVYFFFFFTLFKRQTWKINQFCHFPARLWTQLFFLRAVSSIAAVPVTHFSFPHLFLFSSRCSCFCWRWYSDCIIRVNQNLLWKPLEIITFLLIVSLFVAFSYRSTFLQELIDMTTALPPTYQRSSQKRHPLTSRLNHVACAEMLIQNVDLLSHWPTVAAVAVLCHPNRCALLCKYWCFFPSFPPSWANKKRAFVRVVFYEDLMPMFLVPLYARVGSSQSHKPHPYTSSGFE